MSSMEFNKGKLFPVEMSVDVARALLKELSPRAEYDESYTLMDCFRDELGDQYQEINGKWYRIHLDVNIREDVSFQKATTNEDGSIDFFTYHYIGGGHWTEVVESALMHDGEFKVIL